MRCGTIKPNGRECLQPIPCASHNKHFPDCNVPLGNLSSTCDCRLPGRTFNPETVVPVLMPIPSQPVLGPVELMEKPSAFQAENPGSTPGGATVYTAEHLQSIVFDLLERVSRLENGALVKLENTSDLNSDPERVEGSSPSGPTIRQRRAKVGDIVRVFGRHGRWIVEKLEGATYVLHGEYPRGAQLLLGRREFRALQKKNALNFAMPPSIPPRKGR